MKGMVIGEMYFLSV